MAQSGHSTNKVEESDDEFNSNQFSPDTATLSVLVVMYLFVAHMGLQKTLVYNIVFNVSFKYLLLCFVYGSLFHAHSFMTCFRVAYSFPHIPQLLSISIL